MIIIDVVRALYESALETNCSHWQHRSYWWSINANNVRLKLYIICVCIYRLSTFVCEMW